MKRLFTVVLCFVAIAGCVVSLDDVIRDPKYTKVVPDQVLKRCNYLRTWRDIYANAAIGAGLLGGTGGLVTLGFDNPDHKRIIGAVALGVAVFGAIIGGVAKT